MGLDLNKIVVVTQFPGLKWAGNGIKGKPPFQGAYIHLLFDIWRIRLAVFERTDRDQRHAQITHFFEQAMQRGLVAADGPVKAYCRPLPA